ncbi:MAG: hypothetical protein HOK07_03320 [Candidatus Marinimicrobia bacterium]|nr:hypothetical protein [Candidatus Neomarinimicrobiota bacterium]
MLIVLILIQNIIGTSAAGFQDASLWEKAKEKGDKAIKAMIDKGLENTSVTLVGVTHGTSNRKYINYEINQSLAKGNGLVAIQIHHFEDQNGEEGSPGAIPVQIKENGFKAYKYTNKDALARWIEAAEKLAGK